MKQWQVSSSHYRWNNFIVRTFGFVDRLCHILEHVIWYNLIIIIIIICLLKNDWNVSLEHEYLNQSITQYHNVMQWLSSLPSHSTHHVGCESLGSLPNIIDRASPFDNTFLILSVVVWTCHKEAKPLNDESLVDIV
jgi:hypothetical protein